MCMEEAQWSERRVVVRYLRKGSKALERYEGAVFLISSLVDRDDDILSDVHANLVRYGRC